MIKAIKKYLKHRKNWDKICARCGLCCYTRKITENGEVIADYSEPCEYLDERTKTCRVYHNRFRVYKSCKKVNLYRAMFYRYLPEGCAYRKMFRK